MALQTHHVHVHDCRGKQPAKCQHDLFHCFICTLPELVHLPWLAGYPGKHSCQQACAGRVAVTMLAVSSKAACQFWTCLLVLRATCSRN